MGREISQNFGTVGREGNFWAELKKTISPRERASPSGRGSTSGWSAGGARTMAASTSAHKALPSQVRSRVAPCTLRQRPGQGLRQYLVEPGPGEHVPGPLGLPLPGVQGRAGYRPRICVISRSATPGPCRGRGGIGGLVSVGVSFKKNSS